MNTAEAYQHQPVMLQETLDALNPRSGCVYADATVGLGGHAEAVLDASAPDGRLIGLDRDVAALAAAKRRLARFGDRVVLVHAAFARLKEVLREVGTPHIDGLVVDLGVSSMQLDHAERGFSFARSGPLDMRMDTTTGPTLADALSRLAADELADVLWKYGEERHSRRIARAILEAHAAGQIQTTEDLAGIVAGAVRRRGYARIHPATRTFQALRIYLNKELEQLEQLLADLPQVVEIGGVVVVLSFHSLEDRMIKRAFRDQPYWSPLRRKPQVASETERLQNPRARSAKLRAAQRISAEGVQL